MTEAKVSVIIPLYNKDQYIKRAIDSVLSQTVQDFELIIINDGSTDNSLEMASTYTDPRICIINQKNKGLPATRNRGIKEANADIISFLDADDEWHPNFLETIIRMRKKHPEGGIYATSYEICINNRVRKHTSHSLGDNFEGVITSYFTVAAEFPFVSICVGIPKSVFETCGYFNPTSRMSEDNEMWTKIALHYPIVYSSKVCARYYKYTDNQMTQTYYSMPSDPIKEFISSLSTEYLNACKYTNGLMDYVDHMVIGTAYFNIGAGDMKSARKLCKTIECEKLQLKKRILLLSTLFPGIIGKITIHTLNKLLYTYKMMTWSRKNNPEDT